MLMPFGKHKGRFVHELPKGYLKWCLNNLEELSPDLRTAITKGIQGVEWNPPVPMPVASIDDVFCEWD
jgi:hypothetical protein